MHINQCGMKNFIVAAPEKQ